MNQEGRRNYFLIIINQQRFENIFLLANKYAQAGNNLTRNHTSNFAVANWLKKKKISKVSS